MNPGHYFSYAPALGPKKVKNKGLRSVIYGMENLLTEYQISRIFNIDPVTLKKLVTEGKIPVATRQGLRPRFDTDAISKWMTNNPLIETEEEI